MMSSSSNQDQPILLNPKIRKSSNNNHLIKKLRKSSSEHADERPLKRSPSISYKFSQPTTYISEDNERSSSFNSLSLSTKNMILSRKRSSSHNLANKLKTRFISPMFRSPSSSSSINSAFRTPSSSPALKHHDSAESLNSQIFDDLRELTSPSTPVSPDDFKPFFTDATSPFRRNLLNDLMDCENDFPKLSIADEAQVKLPSKIFEIPEILNIILHHVGHDDLTKAPIEVTPIRRNPTSLNHSKLIHGDNENAQRIWARVQSESSIASRSTSSHHHQQSNLFNCLLVNKLFFQLTVEQLQENLYFNSDLQLGSFLNKKRNDNTSIQPNSLILHKIKSTNQLEMNQIFNASIKGDKLSWLEFYICPNLLPPLNLFSSIFNSNLEKLILPGSKLLDDEYLISILKYSPNLRTIDIRACELITDVGIYNIGIYCPLLESLNCGRHLKGELVSDVSINKVIQSCSSLKTLGVAGCGITDKVIWEIGLKLGDRLERLSLNYCWKLSHFGICKVLKYDYFKKLSVLEIKNLNIGVVDELELKPVIEFKKRQMKRGVLILVEACEELERKLRSIETQLDLEISGRIFNDLSDWLNDDNDADILLDDESYLKFLRDRGRN